MHPCTTEPRSCVKVEVAAMGFPYGFFGRKAKLNHASALVTVVSNMSIDIRGHEALHRHHHPRTRPSKGERSSLVGVLSVRCKRYNARPSKGELSSLVGLLSVRCIRYNAIIVNNCYYKKCLVMRRFDSSQIKACIYRTYLCSNSTIYI